MSFLNKAIRIGRIGGVELRMHIAFPLLILSCFMLGQWPVMRVMLAVLCLHECAHTLAAAALGLKVSSMELTPFGGVARVEGLTQVLPWQDAVIALAGPLSNLLLAMGAGFGAQLGFWSGAAVQMFTRCNLALMVCNLLPALPLDGGRAVRALASGTLGRARATRLFAWSGVVLGAALMGFGVYEAVQRRINPTFFLAGAYMIYCALNERNEITARIVQGLSARASQISDEQILPGKWLAVSADMPVGKLPSHINARGYTMLVVLEPVGLKPLGTIHEGELLDAMMTDQRISVGELLKRREPAAVDVTAKARDAVWRVAREGSGRMMPTYN
ncbi:peptidase M50 [Clostridia bacterium]|nr:peptidase M50 [Clostridia bacterium]